MFWYCYLSETFCFSPTPPLNPDLTLVRARNIYASCQERSSAARKSSSNKEQSFGRSGRCRACHPKSSIAQGMPKIRNEKKKTTVCPEPRIPLGLCLEQTKPHRSNQEQHPIFTFLTGALPADGAAMKGIQCSDTKTTPPSHY